ncbi:MAG: hypothetical protein IKD89_03460 [Clostridia bacterium]|nr:hypothetical protein [Clostridia bacterium]
MKKLKIYALLSILLITALVFPLLVCAEGSVSNGAPFSVASKNAILVEATTDTVIYQKNINDRIVPGELTKLMTAIIAVEYGILDDVVTISETAATEKNFYGANVKFKIGEQLTLRQLLYCMILDNNDAAAAAIAEHISGSEADFARSMTEKAQFIGAQNTNFTNATGQNDVEQYSTVWDMYIIADYFTQSKLLMEIAATKSYTLPPSEWREKKKKFYTNDHLISTYKNTSYYYRYADGLIGGSSSTSGSVMAGVASRGRGSMTLIFIGAGTSGENSKYALPAMKDAENIFREAYASYKILNIVKKGEIMTEERLDHSLEKDYISLVSKDDVSTVIPKDKNEEEITIKLFPKEHIMAPISEGEPLGTFEVYDNDVLIVTGTLTSEETIRANILLKIGYWIKTFFSFTAVRVILIILLVLAVGYVYLLRRSLKRNERAKANRQIKNAPPAARGGSKSAAKKRAPQKNAPQSRPAPPQSAQPAQSVPNRPRNATRMPHTPEQNAGRAKKAAGTVKRAPYPHNKTIKTTSLHPKAANKTQPSAKKGAKPGTANKKPSRFGLSGGKKKTKGDRTSGKKHNG